MPPSRDLAVVKLDDGTWSERNDAHAGLEMGSSATLLTVNDEFWLNPKLRRLVRNQEKDHFHLAMDERTRRAFRVGDGFFHDQIEKLWLVLAEEENIIFH